MALMSMRLNMSTIAHRPRIFSNKENHSSACSPRSRLRSLRSARLSPSSPSLTSTSVSSRSSKSKAKLSLDGIGIGKAPRRAGTVHGVKPYERATSITRAKKRATSPAKVAQPQSILHVRSAPVSAPAQETKMATRMIERDTKVPLRLPRPIIPVVQSMPGELAGIPPVYVLHRLTPHLHSLLYVASQYVPLASSSVAPGSSASRIPFGLPRVMQGDVSLGAKIKGREPNVCLVIRDANDPHAPGKLVPVSSNVYAAQCAFWPRSAPTAESSTSSLIPKLKQLDSIAESNEEDASFDSSFTSTSSTRSDNAEIHEDTAAPGVVNLPLQPLTVPHPTSFPALHLHLHLPARPLFPVLLAFPSTITSSEHADLPKLVQDLSIQEMLRRLEWIRGFWGNVCALGISSDRTWAAMSEAWSAVIAEMIRRSGPAK